MLSGGLGAASFPPFEQTIAKASQQRRKKREGGRKTSRKRVKKGLHKSQNCGTSGHKTRIMPTTKCWKDSLECITQAVVREKTNHESYSVWKHRQHMPSQDYLLELFGHSFSAPCLDQRRDNLGNYSKIPRQGMKSAMKQATRLGGRQKPSILEVGFCRGVENQNLCPHRLFPYAAL